MPRRRTSEKDVEIIATAYLASQGKRNKQISEELDISEVAVARNLIEARQKYLRTELTFLRKRVGPAMMRKVQQRLTHKPLLDKLNRLAERHDHSGKLTLRVFCCGHCRDDRARMEKLGEIAAPLVRTLLRRAGSCGLTWGGMLEAVVAALSALPYPTPWTREPIEFIPLSGEPLGRERRRYSSSSLARELGAAVNGPTYEAPSLAMVPAFIPDGFEEAERDGVRKLIELVKDYLDIFGHFPGANPSSRRSRRAIPKAEELDMILTSVGSSDRPLGFGRGVLFEKMSVHYHDLSAMLAAEVGGVCIPCGNLTRVQDEQFDIVRESWTGLRIEHLQKCAQRGVDPTTGPPGVVVVSGGTKRATAVCELVKRGLINYLIIDEILAAELEATLP